MKQFNVIIWDFNKQEFVPYDVIEPLVNACKKTKEKLSTFEDYRRFIAAESMYRWWAKCEYEILLTDFPCEHNTKKVDVYWQLMHNIDLITEIVMEECTKKNKK